MLSLGLKGSFIPSVLKLKGIICMRPFAPLFDTAFGLKSDSAFIIAFNSGKETPCLLDASSMYSSYLFVEEGPENFFLSFTMTRYYDVGGIRFVKQGLPSLSINM